MSEDTRRILGFLLVATIVVGGGHVYLYRRLVSDVTRHRAWRLVGAVAFTVLALALLSARLILHQIPDAFGVPLATAIWAWFGLGAYLLFFLWPIEAVRGLLSVGRRLGRKDAAPAEGSGAPAAAPSPERRQFLARAIGGGAAAMAGGLGVYGTWRTFEAPLISEVSIRLPGLPRALDGMSIVQLSDIHVGGIVRRKFMDEMVRQANALKPDLVAVTGDLVDGDVPSLGHAVAALRDLHSRFGTYFVTGNHEYYAGVGPWTAALEGMGVQCLRNRRVEIGDAGGTIDLVGVDDWSQRGRAGGYDLDQALAGRDASRGAVLLCHQPVELKKGISRGVGLQLSGHTHGGQMFPGTVAVHMLWSHAAGLYREGDGHIYVSRGTGFWGPPMRVGSPPEIVKITLTA